MVTKALSRRFDSFFHAGKNLSCVRIWCSRNPPSDPNIFPLHGNDVWHVARTHAPPSFYFPQKHVKRAIHRICGMANRGSEEKNPALEWNGGEARASKKRSRDGITARRGKMGAEEKNEWADITGGRIECYGQKTLPKKWVCVCTHAFEKNWRRENRGLGEKTFQLIRFREQRMPFRGLSTLHAHAAFYWFFIQGNTTRRSGGFLLDFLFTLHLTTEKHANELALFQCLLEFIHGFNGD